MKTNEELRLDVIDELKWDPQLIGVHSQIGVATHEGVVTLTGLVDSYSKKMAAEKAAQRVLGVKVVASEIDVKISQAGKRTDTEIAEAIKNALLWNSAVNEDLIEVKVENGWIYLSGEVEWAYQRSSVQNSIENLFGVIGITNNIIIKPKTIDTKDIKDKISAAYLRNASIDSSSISIETSGSKVTLRGKVRSWAEKKEAQNIAWLSPGVVSVDNKIEIDTEVFA